VRWLRDLGCAFIQIDKDGELVLASGSPRLDDPRLRRAQALAPWNGAGIALARDLSWRKLTGQASGLETKFDRAVEAERIRAFAVSLAAADTPDVLRQIEAEAAATHWGAWTDVPVRWAKREECRVPDHWRTFVAHTSPLTRSPRLAANPANALLNYAYALLEAEARIATLSVGLDPGMWVLHADLKARDSLALDLMEATRPNVDAWLLSTLSTRTFRKADFFETREGNCRLMPPLAKAVAETTPRWTAALGPIAEHAARLIVQAGPQIVRVPTLLTEANRRAGRTNARHTNSRTFAGVDALPAACRECGVVLERTWRAYCDECHPERRTEQVTAWAAAGQEALAQLREEGIDPAHNAEAGPKRGQRNASHNAAAAAWKREGTEGAGTMDFVRDVLPGLRSVPLRRLAQATGLSEAHCSFVRRGLRVSHRRHWASLMEFNRNEAE
jgi:CRISPR-associated endonuclease Cas1